MDKFNYYWHKYKGILHIAGWLVLALMALGSWIDNVSAYGGQIRELRDWKDITNDRLSRMDGNIEIIVRTLGQKPLRKANMP